MSQWNRLNVQVIKTKRIECRKLDLPDHLVQPRDTRRGEKPSKQHLKFASPAPSSERSNLGSEGHSTARQSNITDSSFDPDVEDSLSSLKTEEDVFQLSFETPWEDTKQNKSAARCLSLPAYLSAKTGIGNETDVCFRPRRLFEKALNLESSSRDNANGSRLATEGNEGLCEWFPRSQELKKWWSGEDNKMNQCRTPPAEAMNRRGKLSLIADRNNNNSSSCDHKRFFRSSSRRRSKSSLDLRRNWEGKILALTSDSVFGAERVAVREQRSRPRSVTLTGSVYALVKAKDKTTKCDTEKRAASESRLGMPKFQTAVWDYIKRRSTKHKGKSDRQSKENSKGDDNEKRSFSGPRNSKNADESTSSTPGGKQREKVCANHNSKLGNTVSSNDQITPQITEKSSLSNAVELDKVSSTRHIHLAKWKSSPNLGCSEATEFAERILQRNRSWTELNSSKDQPKLLVKEFKENPKVLKLLLTTTPELRPIEERLKTLTLSREWLLKELKGLREDDRRLARQFINLRSVIMEIQRAREKEDSDYDSEGEFSRADSPRQAAEKEKMIASDHNFKMHVTPARNILSYC